MAHSSPVSSNQASAALLKSLLFDLHARCTAMKKMLAEPDFTPPVDDYVVRLARRLAEIRRDINVLLQDPALGNPLLLKQQFTQQTSFAELVVTIEAVMLPVVLRFNSEDERLSAVCQRFVRELGIRDDIGEGPMPLVSAFSAEYYYALAKHGLIFAPALETQTLLGWPDMVHEIVHWFLAIQGEALEQKFMVWLRSFIAQEKVRALREQRPVAQADYEWVVQQWQDRWLLEFCTDLISTYLLGPAYLWQHLRLSCRDSNNVYEPSLRDENTHPADEMRLQLMLQMLYCLGWQDEAQEIENQWREWENILGLEPYEPAHYRFCYPQTATKQLVVDVFEMCGSSALKPYLQSNEVQGANSSLAVCLNEAWKRFLKEPGTLDAWERGQLAQIWATCSLTQNNGQVK